MKRSKHSLSHYRLATFDMGELVPVGLTEVLPGDTIQQQTSALIRVSPLQFPVMHPVVVRLHHWFCPNRLLWSGWEDFITGGSDGEGGSSGTYPTLDSGGSGFAAGGLLDYLGVPPGVANLDVCALPVRAYNMIFNEFYRDQDLVTAVSTDSTALQKIAWEKDYFTSARPWTQKGPEVTLPLGTSAPVIPDTTGGTTVPIKVGASTYGVQVTSGALSMTTGGLTGQWNWPSDTNLIADLSSATAVGVNELREALALQRYKEARARYGSRYTEYLRYLGIRSSDARLQRPEYLGGGKQTIAFSEVLQTGLDSTDAGVGTMAGHGIAALRSRRYRRFFEEHGWVLSLMSVRPRTMYAEHLPRHWSRTTKEDYHQRELERIGQQEIFRREVYAEADNAGTGGDAVFGYQDRYDEYRRMESTIHGDFRSTLADWHMGRILGSAPTLNSTFVTCTPTKRIHQEQTADVLWVMVNNNIQARRMVGNGGESRIF